MTSGFKGQDQDKDESDKGEDGSDPTDDFTPSNDITAGKAEVSTAIDGTPDGTGQRGRADEKEDESDTQTDKMSDDTEGDFTGGKDETNSIVQSKNRHPYRCHQLDSGSISD